MGAVVVAVLGLNGAGPTASPRPPTTCRAAASSRPPAWRRPPPRSTRSPPPSAARLDGAARPTAPSARPRSRPAARARSWNAAVQAIGGIEASSRQVAQIIGVIDEIAFQTNLLALNAGVEAARAGDSGRASRSWPRRCGPWPSARPTPPRRSRSTSATSARQVESGVELVGAAGETLQKIAAQGAGHQQRHHRDRRLGPGAVRRALGRSTTRSTRWTSPPSTPRPWSRARPVPARRC